ncbi:uncharacterized protein LOC119101614 [Pollicipes pollicipes]|uniref:uncharacterized protein LOC119101614 n=1 Tax=Pollicipes pollicipes TaxID=41117 RepID=UPI0018857B16|nr:uncharacterized protein LOC119101614 [Pollicipes pollicipes]
MINTNLNNFSFPLLLCLTISPVMFLNQFGESSIPNAEIHPGSNLTHKQIAQLLRQHGYGVIEYEHESPLAVDDDIIYTPEQVLPELFGHVRAATNILRSSRVWLDKEGRASVNYFYDTETKANRKLFQQALDTWASSTCITFKKLADGKCTRKTTEPGICVGNRDLCQSMIGNNFKYTKGFQKLSIGDDCELFAAAHEFGHALGLHHQMGRYDRDQFITVNFRNFELELMSKAKTEEHFRFKWNQGKRCKKGQTFETSIPVPYDYMSLMQYGESDFADADYRIIFATRDAHYQYMFDYARSGGYLQTHYDKFVLNSVYKCPEKWAAACRKSGSTPPKCQHNGYVNKDCKCACPEGFRGSQCEKKHGSLFPVLDRAKVMIDVSKPGRVVLKGKGMHTNNDNYPLRRFIYYQYVTVVIKGQDAKTMTSVRVYEPGDVAKSYTLKLGKILSYFQQLESNDCEYGFLFFWGNSSRGLMRTECFSSFVNNEPKENAPVFRAKDRFMDIVMIAKLGEMFSYAGFTKWMLEMLQITVSFPQRPQGALKLMQSPGGTMVSGEDNSTVQGAAALRKAMSTLGGVAAVIGVSLALLLLSAGGIAAGVICWKKRNAKQETGVKDAFVKTFRLESSSSGSEPSSESGSD